MRHHLPATAREYLRCVACETARMSYPGSMSRGKGKRQVVKARTKERLKTYFAKSFPLAEIWNPSANTLRHFDDWHEKRLEEITRVILMPRKTSNDRRSVAAKFLNTFMHQLMKWKQCQGLRPKLHLPLDRSAFKSLRELQNPSLKCIRKHLRKSPYKLPYRYHLEIQAALKKLVKEFNDTNSGGLKLNRIDLNCCLWA
jgi:hypothetical protein